VERRGGRRGPRVTHRRRRPILWAVVVTRNAIAKNPQNLVRTITWGPGTEKNRHLNITVKTGLLICIFEARRPRGDQFRT
jgi:hypothetical protein